MSISNSWPIRNNNNNNNNTRAYCHLPTGPETRGSCKTRPSTTSMEGDQIPAIMGIRLPYVRLRRQVGWIHTHTTKQSKKHVFFTSGGHISASDLRFKLLMAGDIERNPGPPGYMSGRDCEVCHQKIRRGATPVQCCDQPCDVVCHVNHSKADSVNGLWRCETHRSNEEVGEEDAVGGSAQIKERDGATTAEPKPTEIITEEEKCAGCGKKFSRVQIPIACTQCHSKRHQTCTGLNRYQLVPIKANDNSWVCRVCTGEDANQIAVSQTTDQTATRESSIKCARTGCKVPITRTQTPVTCSKCDEKRHQSCTGLSRDSLVVVKRNGYQWVCEWCSRKPVDARPFTAGDEVDDDAAKGLKSADKENIRIMQWNANGINPKVDELRAVLKELEIDICLIQESKLRPGSPTPYFQGYGTYRSDRTTTKAGGGLISLIRDSIIFEKVHAGIKEGTEVQTFRVRMSRRKWITITNVYCAPHNSRGHDINENVMTELIPSLGSSIISGIHYTMGRCSTNGRQRRSTGGMDNGEQFGDPQQRRGNADKSRNG